MIAVLDADARQGRVGAAAARLDADRPPALGARPQVRRDHARARRRARLRGRRHDPARAGHADAGRARRVPEHVRRQDARGAAAANLTGFGDRVRRPRRVDQHGDRRVPAAAARRHPGDAEPVGAGDRPARLRPRARHARPRSSRPRPRRRPRCSATSTPRCRALREVARPFIQDSITEGKPALDAGIRDFPQPAAVPAPTPRACSASCGPASRALRTAAPALADALGAGIEVLPQDAAAQPRLDVAAARSCRRSPRTRWSRTASRRRPTALNALQPDARLPRAGADAVQLRDAVLPQHLLAAQRGRPQRHLAAVHHRHHAAGPEQRGRPVLGAGQRADARPTTCTPTRTRTRRRRASRRSARRATSRTPAGADRDRQRARARSRRRRRATTR